MAYTERLNPYLTAEGMPAPGQSPQARAFALAENERYLASLPPAERVLAELRQRNAQAHQNS